MTLLSTGQIVDAVIMPVAAHAAVIPGQYYDNRRAARTPAYGPAWRTQS